MKISLFAIITLVAFLVQSQETVNYRRYNWETDIKMEKYESSVNHDKEATIVLYKRGIINTGKTVEDISDKRMFYHKIIWIENESAIDKINKLYLGENARKGGQLSVSFRVIDTNNMIRSLEINAEDQIKDIEQNGRKYKIV